MIVAWSRLWITTVVDRRSRRNTHDLLKDTELRSNQTELFRVTTDGFSGYACVICKVRGDSVVYTQVIKILRNNRIIKVTQKLIIGTSEQFQDALERSEDSTSVNTSLWKGSF